MNSDRAWRDHFDSKVSVDCPECGATVRLTLQQAEYDEVILSCPNGHQFDHHHPIAPD